MKVLLKIQATSRKPRRRGAQAEPEQYLELDITETTVTITFPDEEKTKATVDRDEMQKVLKFLAS
jgi:hypothetical protein